MTVSLLPGRRPGADVLGALKQGLIQGLAETAMPAPGIREVNRIHASTAYLAFVIRYVKGWAWGQSCRLLSRAQPRLVRECRDPDCELR